VKTLVTVIRSVVALVGAADRILLSVQFMKTNLIMKTNLKLLPTRIFCAVVLGIGSLFGRAAATENTADAPTTTAIPWSQLGAKAGADYHGDVLAVGSATDRTASIQQSTSGIQLPATGKVSIDGQSVRFTRPGLVEDYTASMDGVRQDFLVMERPYGLGELVLRLAVSWAKVESAAFGAQVALANSGRRIAYSRLRVTDAMGKELTARLQVASDLPAPATLAVSAE
jgi:hypothetical protein